MNGRKLVLAVAVAAMLTGCGTSSPAPAASTSSTSAPATTPAAVVATTPATAADARLLIDALATGSSATMQSAVSSVSGPVMMSYITLQVIEDAAAEGSGQPYPAESVTAIGGGYQLCVPQGQCDSVTGFQTDAAGRITGMDVDGEPVAARLATGPSDHANGLVLTDVTSYVYTNIGRVGVAFHVRNESNSGVSTDGFLPLLVTPDGTRLQPDLSQSTPNSDAGPLGAGQTEALLVVFDTRTFTGTFILLDNAGDQDLVSSRLVKFAS